MNYIRPLSRGGGGVFKIADKGGIRNLTDHLRGKYLLKLNSRIWYFYSVLSILLIFASFIKTPLLSFFKFSNVGPPLEVLV